MRRNHTRPVSRERDPRFRTADRELIVDGLRVWDDLSVAGTVWLPGRSVDMPDWDGTFLVLLDDGNAITKTGQQLRVRRRWDHSPVPAFVDDHAEALRAAAHTGAQLIVQPDHLRGARPAVLVWTPRIPADPTPWLDTANERRYRSADLTPDLCDYCDQQATRHAVNSDDVLCDTDARDHYHRWREATRPLTARDMARRTHR